MTIEKLPKAPSLTPTCSRKPSLLVRLALGGLLFLTVACDRGVPNIQAPTTATSGVDTLQTPNPISTSVPVIPSSSVENSFATLQELYSKDTLPQSYPYRPNGPRIEWSKRRIPNDLEHFLIGEGKIKLEDDEEIFAVDILPVHPEITTLVSYVMGDFTEQYILSTHGQNGDMIAHVIVWMVSEEKPYGYASDITSTKRVLRSKMIRNDAGEIDVASEEIFVIGENGSITLTE